MSHGRLYYLYELEALHIFTQLHRAELKNALQQKAT